MNRFVPFLLASCFSVSALTGCTSAGGENAAVAVTPAAPAVEQAGGSISTGLGIVTSVGSSAAATADAAGRVQVDSIIAVVTLDENGMITKCSIDSAQTRVAFDAEGKVTSDMTADILTKGELGESYGMRNASPIKKEWFEQAAALEEWCIGKTAEQVVGMPTKFKDDAHPRVPDAPELAATVTISVGDYLAAVQKAATNAKPANVEAGYKTGLAISTSIDSSSDATADANGRGQVDTAVAAVTVDANGVIVACSLDSAQTRVAFNNAGELQTDLAAPILSKLELQDDYNMRARSGIGKEWFEQAEAFAEWCVGKTAAEVSGMQTKKVDDAHQNVPDVAELASSVTVDAGEFISVVEKAVANAR